MERDQTNQDLLDGWRQGDQNAARLLYERFQRRLRTLVRARLARRLARRIDPEDIVMSAYRSFFVAAKRPGVQVAVDGDLWPLLVTLTLRKLAHQVRRHQADRRSIDSEASVPECFDLPSASTGPTAEQAAMLEDEIAHLLVRLGPRDREILIQTLQGKTSRDLASELGVSERTVRRVLEQVRGNIEARDNGLQSVSNAPRHLPIRLSRTAFPLPPGTAQYRDYLLQQFRGAGSFSKVYQALDRVTGATVAIKFLRRECWEDSRARAAIIREFEILRSIRHPHVIAVSGWGVTAAGGLFLVTDYLAGGDLGRWCESQQLSTRERCRCAVHVAQAVAAAHEAGILHCDLKPANVLVGPSGEIALCDFGLARYATDPDDVPRGGTAGFLAPEQISDEFGPLSVRTDVYGLGALLYALLTGRAPMQGRDLPETLANVLSLNPPSSICQRHPEVPEELERIVNKCLSKEPEARYSSADEVAHVLAESLRSWR